MSMMDFASALGGGGAPPMDPGAAPGGPPPGPPPGAAPEAPPDGGGGEDFTNGLEALEVAQEALQAFIRIDPDHADRAIAAKCLENVIKLIASNQESAQGGDLMSLTRALQGGPTANAGLAAGGGGGGY